MKIAIHHRNKSFSQGWIDYCDSHNIDYKIVNCYDNNIIEQVNDCDILMWHHHHESGKDIQFAKQLLYSLEMSGKLVFPDFRTNWHFDDKVGQKYLLEMAEAPLVPTKVFFSPEDALKWIDTTEFPKVFKLRGGSGSMNVRLVKSKLQAARLARKAFRSGFKNYNSFFQLKDRWLNYRTKGAPFRELLEGVARFFIPTRFTTIAGRERGYVYFQDFIAGNTHDIRINYVFNKCFASRRKVREGDFRASGSGIGEFDMQLIPDEVLRISFDVANKLKLQSAAFDFVLNDGCPLITEISYGFGTLPEMFNHGYWDERLNYFPGPFNPYAWMVEGVLDERKARD